LEVGEDLMVIEVGDKIETIDWEYADKRVRLHFFRCTVTSEPHPLEGQEMAWVSPEDLGRYEFPAADAALLAHLERKP
jgi:A/G-specific adenine glycosylase